MALIKQVKKSNSLHKVLLPNDELISINGIKITDCFDFMYNFNDYFLSPRERPIRKKISVEILRNGEKMVFEGKSSPGELGIEFDSSLMDKPRACKNKCCFCFIDQLPPHMRQSVYYKDDDYRLSIIFGNYVTLTNMTDFDFERIKELHLSPLNISVHATDPQTRIRMMKNPNAGKIMEQLRFLADSGIRIRAQIVLCKGINDGEILEKTLSDLLTVGDSISSVSIVPVGLTRFRDGLEKLEPFTKEDSLKIIKTIDKFADISLKQRGQRTFFAADEIYLKAELPIPPIEFYESLEQIENGVGMLAKYKDNLESLLEDIPEYKEQYNFTMITGEAAAGFFSNTVIPLFKTKLPRMNCSVKVIRNDYFGENITVAGLITGQDIINQIKNETLGDFLLIPSVMLRDDTFLDDITVNDVEKETKTKVRICGPTPADMFEAITQKKAPYPQFC